MRWQAPRLIRVRRETAWLSVSECAKRAERARWCRTGAGSRLASLDNELPDRGVSFLRRELFVVTVHRACAKLPNGGCDGLGPGCAATF
jgi:hypothetical protein